MMIGSRCPAVLLANSISFGNPVRFGLLSASPRRRYADEPTATMYRHLTKPVSWHRSPLVASWDRGIDCADHNRDTLSMLA